MSATSESESLRQLALRLRKRARRSRAISSTLLRYASELVLFAHRIDSGSVKTLTLVQAAKVKKSRKRPA